MSTPTSPSLVARLLGVGAAAFLLTPVLSAQQIRVGLCAAAGSATACQWSDVQTRLLATNQFSAVDVINVALATPTLAQLQQYDALLCWTNTTPLDTNAWGDVLANYVDGGGGVVVAVFANSSQTTNRNIGGRWQNGYLVVMDRSGSASGANGTLGTVHVPGHPVMSGVAAFQGGSTGSRPFGTTLAPGATLIAEWSDGKVLVAEGANPQRIDLGFYPPHSSCSGSGWTIGGDLLMTNALFSVAKGGAFAPFGTGCAGALGIPELSSGAVRPTPGASFSLQIDKLPSGAAFIVLGFANDLWGPFTLPYDLGSVGMTGCDLLIAPAVTAAIAGSPSATLPLQIPNDPGLIGGYVYAQGFVPDPSANSLGLSVSNGGRIRVGL